MKRFIGAALVLLLGLMSSCGFFRAADFAVRVRINTAGANFPVVLVNVEGADGGALTGALVSLRVPGNRAYVLDYQANYGAYRLVLDSRVSGTYTVTVDSLAGAEPVVVEAPHEIIADAPAVIALVDAYGASTASGQNMAVDGPISVSWSAPGEDLAFSLVVGSGLNVVYQTSTAVADCVIPAGTLPAGKYLTVSVSAIRQRGDPLLKTSNYFSVSSRDGNPYGFSTE